MRNALVSTLLCAVAAAGGADGAAALLKGGDAAKAESEARKLYQADPKNADALIVLADAMLALDRAEEVWTLLEAAEPVHGGDARLHLRWGHAFLKLAEQSLRESQGGAGLDTTNLFLDAKRMYEQALARDAKNVEAVYGMAYVAYSTGAVDEAKTLLAKALGIGKTHAPTHALQALLLYNERQYAAAEEGYRRARELDDSDPMVCLMLGHTQVAQGKLADAKASYLYTLKRHPDYAPAIRVGLCAMVRNDWAKLAPILQEALKEIRNSAPLWFYAGFAHLQGGANKDALAAFQEARKLDARNAQYAYYVGYALEADGKAEEALEQYREALRLDPAFDEPAYRFQGIATMKADIERAEKLYEELIKLAPGNALIHNNYALLLRDWAERRGATGNDPPQEVRRRIRRSGEVYEIAASLSEDDPQIQSDTGLLFEFYPCNRDDAKAERYFTRALVRSDYLYRDAFDGLARLCRRARRWEVLRDFAEGVVAAIDRGGVAIAPTGGGEPRELATETPGLRARAEAALAEANQKLGS